MLRIYLNNERMSIGSTGVSVVQSQWDNEKERVKGRNTESLQLNQQLDNVSNSLPSSKVRENVVTESPKVDTTKGNIKEQVASVVRMVLKHYRFCSLGELNAVLSAYNVAVEEVKTEFRGKKYDGLVYVPTDEKGVKTSTPLHASEMGRGVGYTAVKNKMQKSRQAVKPLIPVVRRKILEVMRTSPQTEEVLLQRLEEQGLRVVIRRNDNGRLYGITFIDDEQGIAINGSRLGKGYSANVFNTYLSNPTDNPFLDVTLYGNPSLRPEQTNIALPMQPNVEEGDNLIDELIEELVGEPFASVGNDDWKEAAWQRKLRRKSKINLKRRK